MVKKNLLTNIFLNLKIKTLPDFKNEPFVLSSYLNINEKVLKDSKLRFSVSANSLFKFCTN